MDELDSTAASKRALRESVLRARRELQADERRDRSQRACDRLLALPELRTASTVLAYAAMADEADPSGAVRLLVGGGTRVLLPRVVGDLLEIAEVGRGELALGPFGILEPKGPPVAPSQVDLAIIPGVAFDRTGGRLGHGRGFYDRFLSQCRPDMVRIGFALSCQMAARVPRESHDESVDMVVTEAAVHRMRQPPPTVA